jgi:toxin ParE1/3/4
VALRVNQTARARADLLAIWFKVAADDVAAADRLFGRLEARLRILETFAEAGRSRPDIAPGARVLVERPYLILYRLVPGGVQIVRVLHGARRIDWLLFSEEME